MKLKFGDLKSLVYAKNFKRSFYRDRVLKSENVETVRLDMQMAANVSFCYVEDESGFRAPKFNVFLSDRYMSEAENKCLVIISCEYLKHCGNKSKYDKGCSVVIKTDLDGNEII